MDLHLNSWVFKGKIFCKYALNKDKSILYIYIISDKQKLNIFFNSAFKVLYIETASAMYHTTLLEDKRKSNTRV